MQPWSPADVADALIAGLAAAARAVDAEQAVDGLDDRREIDLHESLAGGARAAGWGVEREVRYPLARGVRRRSEGDRCDLVLVPDGGVLRAEPGEVTLFEPPDAVDPEDACWVEVKTVAQFRRGVADPAWSSRLGGSVRADVRKLATAPGVRHAALAILAFAAEPEIAEHDLRVWHHVALDHGLPVGAPALRRLPITDRHGNAFAVLAVHPIGRSSGIRDAPPETRSPDASDPGTLA